MWPYFWGDIYKYLLNPDREMTTDQDVTKVQLCESTSLLRLLKGEGFLKGAEMTQRQPPPPSMGNSSRQLEAWSPLHSLQEAHQVGEFDLFQAAWAVWASCGAPGDVRGQPSFLSRFILCLSACSPALLKAIFFLFRASHIVLSSSLFCLHIFF